MPIILLIMEDFFYKENAQLRYNISKELEHYREKCEKEKSTVKDFVVPIFSVGLSSCITFVLNSEKMVPSVLWMKVLIISICFVISFIIVYCLSQWLLKLYVKIRNNIIPIGSSEKKRGQQECKLKLIHRINFDIVMCLNLADSLIKEDDESKKLEAFFYVNRATDKIRKAFDPILDNSITNSDFSIFQLNIVINKLKNILLSLKTDGCLYKDSVIKSLIDDIIQTYNDTLLPHISKKYEENKLPENWKNVMNIDKNES